MPSSKHSSQLRNPGDPAGGSVFKMGDFQPESRPSSFSTSPTLRFNIAHVARRWWRQPPGAFGGAGRGFLDVLEALEVLEVLGRLGCLGVGGFALCGGALLLSAVRLTFRRHGSSRGGAAALAVGVAFSRGSRVSRGSRASLCAAVLFFSRRCASFVAAWLISWRCGGFGGGGGSPRCVWRRGQRAEAF